MTDATKVNKQICSFCGQEYDITQTHWCPNAWSMNPNWQKDQRELEFMQEVKSLLLQIVEKLEQISRRMK